MKKLVFLVCFTLSIFTNAFSQELKPEKPSLKLIEKIKKEQSFIENTIILKEFGAEIDLKSANMYTFPNKSYEIVFSIIDKNNAYDYKKMVIVSRTDNFSSYFDEKKDDFKGAQTSSLLSCYWEPWTSANLPLECDYNFWCFSSNKQATYAWEFRRKICNGSVVKVVFRRIKLNCGC